MVSCSRDFHDKCQPGGEPEARVPELPGIALGKPKLTGVALLRDNTRTLTG